MKRILLTAKVLGKTAILICVFFCSAYVVQAQRPSPSVGIGFQVGAPTGLNLQFYRAGGMSTDLLFAWDLHNFFFVNIHGLWDHHLDRADRVHFYYGPGLFLGIHDRKYREEFGDNNPVFGVSGNFGLNVVFGRAELFGQLTPRLAVTPGTDFDLGGGAGLRFFF